MITKQQEQDLSSWLTVMAIRIREDSPHVNLRDNLQYHFDRFVYRHHKEFKLSMMEREKFFDSWWDTESGFEMWGKKND